MKQILRGQEEKILATAWMNQNEIVGLVSKSTPKVERPKIYDANKKIYDASIRSALFYAAET